MKLSPNVGSDRSWVWNAAADVSEGEPEAITLAIRFGNPDSMYRDLGNIYARMLTYSPDANAFKDAFIKAQKENEALFDAKAAAAAAAETEEKKVEEAKAEAA